MNAVLYARVSTDKQAEKDLSIPAQLQAMRDYARQHDWKIAEEFIEPGASAKTTDRPALQRLLSLVRETDSTIDVVLVHKIDRLARNVYDHATIKAFLKQHEIRLASVVENMDDSVSGQLIENIMASIAQFYSANLAGEVRKGMRQKVLKGGWPHRPPRGYVVVRERDGKSTHIEIHPREGPLMRTAFDLYASGWYSIRRLSERLGRQGVVSRTGRPISQAYLRNLLTNPFYAGRLRWGDLEIPGKHPPLVALDLFEKVQTVIKSKYRNPGVKGSVYDFPLRGLATCSTCRGHMTAERHDGRWGYYRCGRNAYQKELCRARFCNSERAHRGLERVCKQIRLSRATAEAIREAADALIRDRIASAQQKREALEAEQARLLEQEMRLTEGFTTGDISPNAYKVKTAGLKKRQVEVVEQLNRSLVTQEALTAKVDETLRLATSLWDLYEQLSDLKRIDLLRSVFSAIVLGPEGVVGFTLKPPFDRIVHASTTAETVQRRNELAGAILTSAEQQEA